jgi:hypothetical protein
MVVEEYLAPSSHCDGDIRLFPEGVMFGILMTAVNSTTVVTLQVLFDRQTKDRVSGMYVSLTSSRNTVRRH